VRAWIDIGAANSIVPQAAQAPKQRMPRLRHDRGRGTGRFITASAFAWTTSTERMTPRNISGATFDPAAATLSVQAAKRRVA
jgi:hypothetical protein